MLFAFALGAYHLHSNPVNVVTSEYEELTHTPSLETALVLRKQILEQMVNFERKRTIFWSDLPFTPKDMNEGVHHAAQSTVTSMVTKRLYATDQCMVAHELLADALQIVDRYHLEEVDFSSAQTYVTQICMQEGMASYE
jgi:hypothetical protein